MIDTNNITARTVYDHMRAGTISDFKASIETNSPLSFWVARVEMDIDLSVFHIQNYAKFLFDALMERWGKVSNAEFEKRAQEDPDAKGVYRFMVRLRDGRSIEDAAWEWARPEEYVYPDLQLQYREEVAA